MERFCFIEDKDYIIDDFMRELKKDKAFVENFIVKLVKRNILKTINRKSSSEFIDDGLEELFNEDNGNKAKKNIYHFKYVGIIIYEDSLICMAPKYRNQIFNEKEQNNLIKLFKNYSKREKLEVRETEFLGYSNQDNNNNNILGCINYILDDYIENGLYINYENKLETNGSGRIDWNRTIEKNSVFWNKSMQPIYVDVITNRSENNEELLITNIHKYILNSCLKTLDNLELREILEYGDIEFNEDYGLFEDDSDILYYLENELDNQFIDRKINLIEGMIAFINKKTSVEGNCEIQFYGTRFFNIVWEKTLGYVFNNQFRTYKKYIPEPVWVKNDFIKENRRRGFIPDILVYYEEINTIIIYDAKYYNFHFDDDGNLNGQAPGVEDIVKQLAYESVFRRKFKYVENIFLIPSNDKTGIVGVVKLDLFGTNGEVKILRVEAENVYDNYIKNKIYDKGTLLNILATQI